MTVDVVLNRRARQLRGDDGLRALIVREAQHAGARVHETRDDAQLEAAARSIAARGSRAVVLAGGDGSYMSGLSALVRACGDRLPAIVLAPGGTASTVARSLGVAVSGTRAWVDRALRAAGAKDPALLHQPTLHVRDDATNDRVGFIFGAGLVAGFFDRYYAAGGQGLASAAGLAARVAGGALVGSGLAREVLAPVGCAIEVDGVRHPSRAWSLVLASVLRDVGLHIQATYRAGEDPGRFHVVASGRTPRGLATQLPRVLLGRPMRGGPHVDAQATSLAVAFDPPRAYILDGDVFRTREVRVSPGPVVRVIRI